MERQDRPDAAQADRSPQAATGSIGTVQGFELDQGSVCPSWESALAIRHQLHKELLPKPATSECRDKQVAQKSGSPDRPRSPRLPPGYYGPIPRRPPPWLTCLPRPDPPTRLIHFPLRSRSRGGKLVHEEARQSQAPARGGMWWYLPALECRAR